MDLPFPRLYLLKKDISDDERQILEQEMNQIKCRPLTHNASDAEVFIGKIYQKPRALIELRWLGITTDEVLPADPLDSPRVKRRRIAVDDDTDSELSANDEPLMSPTTTPDTVKVVKLAWYTESMAQGKLIPYANYLLYEGRKVEAIPARVIPVPSKPPESAEDIWKRALGDSGGGGSQNRGHSSYHSKWKQKDPAPLFSFPPRLHRESTTEQEENAHLPELPDYMHLPYACQRPTPANPPNAAFIEQLVQVRTHRKLMGDEIGVRAYSSSIAALSAYPYKLKTAAEVERLPSCSERIGELFQEFTQKGIVSEAAAAEADERMIVLREFSKIFGVAEKTAREFFNKGWRDCDDIVEFGWQTLSRNQQIGLKFFDELQERIPRDEVGRIAEVVLSRANMLKPGFEAMVVGSYRRGNESSGDVDIVLSHRDESATFEFIDPLVRRLEKDRYITHTLSMSTKNSSRGQTPVSWKAQQQAGSGFDTLDKALTVWRDPEWIEDGVKKREDDSNAKENPNSHRQVDIIISPWRTVGCAVLGWSGGTTFQRDLRRFCKKEHNLKFDSSGIRNRSGSSHEWVDLEDGGRGPAPDMEIAERRVFEGLGLAYRPPTERCTR